MTRRDVIRAAGAAISLRAGSAELTALDPYSPKRAVHGTLRSHGSDLAGLMQLWQRGFQAFHPAVRFENFLKSSDSAINGLVAGADLAPSGREAELAELLSFQETFGYEPLSIAVATGSFDVLGRTWGVVIFVHKDNPITAFSLDQLDGIFGAERTGGWQGLKWMPHTRPAERNLRKWGQLGLTGEWEQLPIQTYGYAPSGMSNFFELAVFHGGTKWNENYRQYVETGSKLVGGTGAEALTIQRMFQELASDRRGIAWAGMAQARGVAGVKPVSIGAVSGGPSIYPSKASFQNRTYPLVRSIFMHVNRPPNQSLNYAVEEFLRYILSREGQQAVVVQSEYIPLTAEMTLEELRKIERSG